MTMALSKAVEAGAEAVICASTGNTSAAAAAYAARAGISCIVLLPAGKIAMGKLVQAFMYGARVVSIDGNFDDALRLVREIGETEPVAIVNSINPHSGSKARRPRRSRLSRNWAMRRICTSSRSVMRATSPRIGKGIANFTGLAGPAFSRECSVSRPRAPRPFITTR